jgi:hypothetical protein
MAAGGGSSAAGGSSTATTSVEGSSGRPVPMMIDGTSRQVAATAPAIGTTRNMPRIPATSLPTGTAISTIAGWRERLLPYTIGVTMLPCTMLNTTVKISIQMTSEVVPSATVTRVARIVEMNDPMYGMNPAKKLMTMIGMISGIPRIQSTKPVESAPNPEMAAVPIM